MASVSPTAEQLEGYFRSIVPDPLQCGNKREVRLRAELHRLFEAGIGHDIPGVKHTLWCAYNAVTELTDRRTYRGRNNDERATNRLKSIWWGEASKLKEQAWELALQLAV